MIDYNRLKIKRLAKNAIIGTVFESHESSCIDHFNLFSLYEVNIPPRHRSWILTGYSIAIPKGYKGLFYSITATGLHVNGALAYGDKDEVTVEVSNFSTKTINIPELTHFAGMRIAEV